MSDHNHAHGHDDIDMAAIQRILFEDQRIVRIKIEAALERLATPIWNLLYSIRRSQ